MEKMVEPRIEPAHIPVTGDMIKLKVIFKEAGFKLYLVGGAVRDFLLNEPVKDYDLVTDATPDQIKVILDEFNIKYIGIGEQFGVINVIMSNDYEIATFREDSSESDGRRPDSVIYSTIENDVKRRDLTINALYFDIDKCQIIDYVGGIGDIYYNVIRTVGEASDRFREDKLRIMRAIRFANRTGGDLDVKIDRYLRNDSNLKGVSSERIRDEFIKSIKSAKSVVRLMDMYNTYGMFEYIFPGAKINRNFIESKDYIVVIAQLLLNNHLGVHYSRMMNQISYTNNEIGDIRFLMAIVHTLKRTEELYGPVLKNEQKKRTVTPEQITEFGEINDVKKSLIDVFINYELTIKGGEVKEKYNLQGPEIGEKVLELEREIFRNNLK